MNYEKALKELQLIIQSLEEGSISLIDLPPKVSRAGVLIKFCKENLRGIEDNLSSIIYDEEE